MEKYLTVVNNKIDDLIKITISERKLHGMGVSFLDFCEPDKMDFRYVGVSNELFPQPVREKYLERMKSVPNSIIFFLLYDGNDELFYEVDLDENSTFHKNNNL